MNTNAGRSLQPNLLAFQNGVWMKFRPAIIFAAIILLLSCSPDVVRAQSDPTDAPPAFAIAQRLYNEAVVAQQAARVLTAAGRPGPWLDAKGFDGQGNPNTDPTTGSYQHHYAHIRAWQAAMEYMVVTASAEYGHTAYAPEACYQAALIEKYFLHDNTAAMASLQLIDNKFSDITFPDKANAAILKSQLAVQINQINKTTFPGSILYGIIDFFVKLTGSKSYSYALAILMISLIVRLAVTPLSNMTYKSMKEQQKLQPLIKEIQAKYKDDKELAGKKTMELYSEHGINPAAGCVPMLIQLPVFILLVNMMRLYQYQFVNGKFLWIGSSLSHMFPSFMATNLGQIDMPLLILYGGSMYLQQKMMTPADPAQAEQQKTMAIMSPFITVFVTLQYHLPSAFVLYYIIFNLLSMAQQKLYMKRRQDQEAKEGKDVLSTPTILLNGSGDGKKNPTTSNGKSLTNGKSPISPTNGTGNSDSIKEKMYGKPETGSNGSGGAGSGKAGTGNTTSSPKSQAKKRRRQ